MSRWRDALKRLRGGADDSGDDRVAATVLELMILEGADAGQQFTADGPRTTIGRGKPTAGQTGAILLHDATVSSEQAVLLRDDRGTQLTHCDGATNPTLVNGKKIRRQRIAPGDEIRMGRVVIEVRERAGIGLSGLYSSAEIDAQQIAQAADPTRLDAAPTTFDAAETALGHAEPGPTRVETGAASVTSPDADRTQIRVTGAPTARGWLTLVRGVPELENTTYPLTGEQSVVGRSATCDVSIPEPGISRQHCRIEWASGEPVVVHLSSTNATCVNDEDVIGRRKLVDGDEIQLADQVSLRVDLAGDRNVPRPATEAPTLPPQAAEARPEPSDSMSGERSLRAYMEEKLERDRQIEEEFSVQGSFLDVDVVGSYQMKAQTRRPAVNIIVSFERFREFVGGIIREFDGQVLNSNGDELMCFFDSTLASVRAGSAILQRLDRFNERENVLESPFRFRIGIHTGTSLVDRARGVAYSPVLDVAGHLQKQAETNGLLISDATYAALPDDLPFEPAGQLEGDGIPVYRMTKPID